MNNFILVTGGCGYIGSHVTLLLKEQGYQVVVADNLSTGHLKNMIEGVTYEIGDIGDEDFLNNLFNKYSVERVVHLAAKTSTEESMRLPEIYYEENTLKSITLMKICGRHKIKQFIFSSSAAVYGEKVNQPVGEDHFVNPCSLYGKSKYMAELALSELARQCSIQFIIFRYFNVAGHHHSMSVGNCKNERASLINQICQNIALGRDVVSINGDDYNTPDGTCVRDYIHVMDVANAHILFLKNPINPELTREIFNIGYSKGLSVMEVIHFVNKIIGNNLKCNIVNRRKGDIAYSVSDNKKIKSIGWKPLYEKEYEEIIRSDLSWQKKLLENVIDQAMAPT